MPGRDARRPRDTRRLFVAAEVPDPVHRALDAALSPWIEGIPARWVPARNRHVTLRFLGPVDAGSVFGVRAAVASVAGGWAPVQTRLAGFGGFPSARRARVVWAGLADRAGRLAGLAAALDRVLAPIAAAGAAGAAPARTFRPHLTLGRCDPPARLPVAFIATELEPAPFGIDRLVLFESLRGSGHPRYDLVEAAELRG